MKKLTAMARLALAAVILALLVACGASADPAPAERPQQPEDMEMMDEAAAMSATAEAMAGEMSEMSEMGEDEGPAPFVLPLDAPMPRSMHYAGLEWVVEEARIDNMKISLFGDADERTDDYRVARIRLMVKNPLSGYADLGRDIIKLRLGERMYEADETGMLQLPRGGSAEESRLVFRLPADATWDSTALVLSEPHKVPAEMPLQGEMPAPAFPRELAMGGSATAEQVSYTLMGGALNLDLHDTRVEQGLRFLMLKVRVQNNSGGGGGLALTEEHFRLMVNGAPIAPVDATIELVEHNSAYDATVVFAVPDILSAAELLVGVDEAAQPIALQL